MRSLLFPSLSRAFFRGLHTTNLSTCGLSRSYSQAAQVPSSKVTDKFHAVQQKNREWLLLSSLRWTPSLTCPWNARQLLRSLLDGHRAQCTFHCSLRVLLSQVMMPTITTYS